MESKDVVEFKHTGLIPKLIRPQEKKCLVGKCILEQYQRRNVFSTECEQYVYFHAT